MQNINSNLLNCTKWWYTLEEKTRRYLLKKYKFKQISNDDLKTIYSKEKNISLDLLNLFDAGIISNIGNNNAEFDNNGFIGIDVVELSTDIINFIFNNKELILKILKDTK